MFIRKSDPRWYQFHSVLHELFTWCLSTRDARRFLPKAHRDHPRPGQTLLARSTMQLDFESGIDFSDPEPVREAEAEKLSQIIAQVMLGPKHLEDEAVLG